ncbi:MAG: hypothetical protein R2851_13010 [Caldilineaceae bacterium]
MDHTNEIPIDARVKPKLMPELLRLVEAHRPMYGQARVYRRLALVMSELFAFGRHTITQLLLTLGLTAGEEWSSWYRLFSCQRFDEEKTVEVTVREVLKEVPEPAPCVVGVDGFHVPALQYEDAGKWLDAWAEDGKIRRGSSEAALCGGVMVDAIGQWVQSCTRCAA